MAQQGKQGRVGDRRGFLCNSVKLVLLANSNRYEVDYNTFFLSGKALYPYEILSCVDSDLYRHTFASVICVINAGNVRHHSSSRSSVKTGIPKMAAINPLQALVHPQTQKTILHGLSIPNPNFSKFAFFDK